MALPAVKRAKRGHKKSPGVFCAHIRSFIIQGEQLQGYDGHGILFNVCPALYSNDSNDPENQRYSDAILNKIFWIFHHFKSFSIKKKSSFMTTKNYFFKTPDWTPLKRAKSKKR